MALKVGRVGKAEFEPEVRCPAVCPTDALALSLFHKVQKHVLQPYWAEFYRICTYLAIQYIDDQPMDRQLYLLRVGSKLSLQQFAAFELKILELLEFKLE